MMDSRIQDWLDRRERAVIRAFEIPDSVASKHPQLKGPIKYISGVLHAVAEHANGNMDDHTVKSVLKKWHIFYDQPFGGFFWFFELCMIVVGLICVLNPDPSKHTKHDWLLLAGGLLAWTTYLLVSWFNRYRTRSRRVVALLRRGDETIEAWLNRANYSATFEFYPNDLLRAAYRNLEEHG